ncbi:MAG TPA: hypothetical protein VGK67_18270 [Myxococcales bacterium]|jgi:hypothetical protein
MIAPALSLAAALLCTASGATKVARIPLPAGEGVNEKSAQAITDAITGEIRRVPGVKLITQDEIAALLGLERQKGLLGCSDEKCISEIGGALGVDRLVTGRLSKLGETWMFNLKALDPNKATVVGQVDRNVRKASIDDMIELIPTMVGELFGAAPTKGPMRTVEAPKADPAKPAEPAPAPAAAAPAPYKYGPNALDEPIDKGTKTDDLKLVTNGKGLFIAFPPTRESAGVRVFSGDGKSFWQVTTSGGGSNGQPDNFSHNLWDPRFRDGFGVDGSFDSLGGGKYSLTCGQKKKVEVKLEPVGDAEAAKILKGAKFFKARWRRGAHALARDEEGHYFYLDKDRNERETGNLDPRFYLGTKGRMQGFEILDHLTDSSADIYVTSAGRLKHLLGADEGKKGEWIVGQQKTPLVWLDLDGLGPAQLIYTSLGVYAGERLGTPCDAVAK